MRPFPISILIEVVVSSTIIYSPTVFTTQNELLSKSTAASQYDCDLECTANPKCVAVIVERFSDHVLCGYLGSVVDYTICAKPADVYKKVQIAESFIAAGNFGKVGGSMYGVLAGQKTGKMSLSSTKGPSSLVSQVYEKCELHFLLVDKSTLVRKFDGFIPAGQSGYTEYTDEVDGVVDAWAYCVE